MSIITALHSMNVIPSLISRTVSVDVKYHVYFLTYDERCWVGSPVSARACVRVPVNARITSLGLYFQVISVTSQAPTTCRSTSCLAPACCLQPF